MYSFFEFFKKIKKNDKKTDKKEYDIEDGTFVDIVNPLHSKNGKDESQKNEYYNFVDSKLSKLSR